MGSSLGVLGVGSGANRLVDDFNSFWGGGLLGGFHTVLGVWDGTPSPQGSHKKPDTASMNEMTCCKDAFSSVFLSFRDEFVGGGISWEGECFFQRSWKLVSVA